MLPLRLLASRNRSGAYSIMLAFGTAIFAMFYFLTLFMQEVLGYSPLKTGFAYLVFPLVIAPVAGLAANLVGKLGPRTLLMPGAPMAGGGLLWLSFAPSTANYYEVEQVRTFDVVELQRPGERWRADPPPAG